MSITCVFLYFIDWLNVNSISPFIIFIHMAIPYYMDAFGLCNCIKCVTNVLLMLYMVHPILLSM